MPSLSGLLPVILAALLVAACDTIPVQDDRGHKPDEDKEPTGDVRVIPLEDSEPESEFDVGEQVQDLDQAIEEDLREALDSEPPFRQNAYLDAAGRLIDAGRLADAEAVLDEVITTGLAPVIAIRKSLLQAEIHFHRDQLDRALRLAERGLGVENIDPTYISNGLDLKARIELRKGRPLEAARAWVRRVNYLASSREVAENHERIWYALGHLNELELQVAGQSGGRELRGWLDLAILFLDFGGDRHGLRTAVTQWRDANSFHPAAEFADVLLGPPRAAGVTQVGLLLPLSSNYGTAAQMVHNGFDTAHQTDSHPQRPQVVLYDVGGEPSLVGNYVGAAAADGADVIAGPLGKTAVNALLESRRPQTPMVLLGSASERPAHAPVEESPGNPGAPPPDARDGAPPASDDGQTPGPGAAPEVPVYQFDLAPEPEARQVAEFMYASGHRRVAALYPEDEWGQRVYNAFAEHWRELGGTLAEAQAYAPGSDDYTTPITNLFNLVESENRQRYLEGKSGLNLHFDARRRHDIDGLFMAARPDEARLLKPQINFFQGHDLPVYSTSHVYTGTPDAVKDTDLDGITFPEMPWLLRNTARVRKLKTGLEEQGFSNVSTELFAFGFDAYELALVAPDTDLPEGTRLLGLTSELILAGDGRIHRRLDWARFKDGVPVKIWND